MRHRIENLNYHNDRRVRAAEAQSLFTDMNEATMTATFTWEDDGEETTGQVHLTYEVCDLCAGRGKVVNPSIDCGGLSREDFDADSDFREEYLAGRYDITCPQCKGKRVHAVLDTKATSPELLARIQERVKADRDFAREVAAERAMGA